MLELERQARAGRRADVLLAWVAVAARVGQVLEGGLPCEHLPRPLGQLNTLNRPQRRAVPADGVGQLSSPVAFAHRDRLDAVTRLEDAVKDVCRVVPADGLFAREGLVRDVDAADLCGEYGGLDDGACLFDGGPVDATEEGAVVVVEASEEAQVQGVIELGPGERGDTARDEGRAGEVAVGEDVLAENLCDAVEVEGHLCGYKVERLKGCSAVARGVRSSLMMTRSERGGTH